MTVITSIRVYHAYYGCDTGCCGHIVRLNDDDRLERFEFDHGYGKATPRDFARRLAHDVIARYHPDCLASIDWDTIELNYDDVCDE